ncbi:MAG: hypothetical protein IJN43_16100 [Ruminococcus sp.]|nr:hypothetical protein [Oscillospiraceae bacterium]MBQ6945821.1 hypothetical protein [Ruminococcus sp.]
MKNLKVLTKYVMIEGDTFALISFDTPENMVDMYGSRTYGLIDYKYIGDDGRLTKPLMYGEMAISSTPAKAIEQMRRLTISSRWRDAHPNATDQEFADFLLQLYQIQA